MKLIVPWTIIVFAGYAAAQTITVCASASPCAASLSAIPSCGLPCLQAAASSVGCSASDQACQCSNFAAIENDAVGCVLASCTGAVPVAVLNAATSLCACVTANPTTPCSTSASVTSTSSSSSSTTSASTSSSSSTSSLTTSQSPSSSSTSTSSSTTSSSTTSKTSSSSSPITSGPSTSVCVSQPNCGASASAIPSCAQACFSSAIVSDSPCVISDYACQCVSSNYAVISTSLVPCVINACPVTTLAAVVNAANAVCACASSPATTTPCSSSTTSSTSSMVTVTTSSVSVIAPTCNHNNCLRQMIRSSAQISTFCATFTKTVITVSTGLPDYVSQCSGSPSKVSSACSCLVT